MPLDSRRNCSSVAMAATAVDMLSLSSNCCLKYDTQPVYTESQTERNREGERERDS